MSQVSCPGLFVAESVSVVKVRLPSFKIVPSGSAGLLTKANWSVLTVFPGNWVILVRSTLETVWLCLLWVNVVEWRSP